MIETLIYLCAGIVFASWSYIESPEDGLPSFTIWTVFWFPFAVLLIFDLLNKEQE